MTVFRMPFTVSFFVVEPLDRLTGPHTFESGAFPWEDVLARVAELDLSTGDYHVRDSIAGRQTFCLVQDGPLPILAAYTKDPWQTVETEKKGELVEYEFADGEAPIEGSFVAFFPNSVAGIIRTSNKTPGAAKIASWLSLFSGHEMYFERLQRADIASRLNRPPEDFLGVELRSRRSRLSRIRRDGGPRAESVADVLEAVSRVAPSNKIGLYLAPETKKERPSWWSGMRPVLDALADVLDDFDTASVKVSNESPINLLDAYVTKREIVEISNRRKPKAGDAAEGLASAYAHEQLAILAALEARRGQRAPIEHSGPAELVGQPPLE